MPRYCCGCDSRIATLNANIFMLIVGGLYFAVGVYGLNDTNPKTAAAPDERLYLDIVLVVMSIQVIISALAIWGACTYQGWPVMLSLGWTSVNITLTFIGSFVGVFISGSMFLFIRGLILFLIQTSCLWMPQYGKFASF